MDVEGLIEFIRAQLDEDERVALEVPAGSRSWVATSPYPETAADTVRAGSVCVVEEADDRDVAHIARWDPARVLAEVDAKRRILDDLASTCDWVLALQAEGKLGEAATYSRHAGSLVGVARLLALPYADRPGYKPEWRS